MDYLTAIAVVAGIAAIGLMLRATLTQVERTEQRFESALPTPAAMPLASFVVRADMLIQRYPLDMLAWREAADKFAAAQKSSDVVLVELGRTDLLCQYAQGYWLVSSALVRESARRRGYYA